MQSKPTLGFVSQLLLGILGNHAGSLEELWVYAQEGVTRMWLRANKAALPCGFTARLAEQGCVAGQRTTPRLDQRSTPPSRTTLTTNMQIYYKCAPSQWIPSLDIMVTVAKKYFCSCLWPWSEERMIWPTCSNVLALRAGSSAEMSL